MSHLIFVNGKDGRQHLVDPKPGDDLMRHLRPIKIGIIGMCNGNAACGTCHVYVAEKWASRLPDPDEYELEQLADASHLMDTSRLACQIEYRPELDGLELTVAPRE